MEYVQTLLFPASMGGAPALPQTSKLPLNITTVRGPQSIKKKGKKVPCMKQGGRLSGKDRQKKSRWGGPPLRRVAYASNKGLNAEP